MQASGPTAAPSDQVRTNILRAVADHGPISFAEFMELALYGPGGFFEVPPIGEGGHFVTSPHVHPVFGELLSRALREMWEAVGMPGPFHVVELGAGDGTLARALLEALRDLPIEYTAVERSSGARQALSELPVRVVSSLEVLDQHLVGVVLANEVLDNLPFHWIRRREQGLAEIRVASEGTSFVAVEGPCGEELLEEMHVQRLRPGEEAAVSLDAFHLVERLARMLRAGYALLIDYASSGGLPFVRGHRGHRQVGDVLEGPGSADITVGVDFEVISDRLRSMGLETAAPVSQRQALETLGYATWERGARDRQAEHLRKARGREAVRTWSDRNAARVLVEREGLGGIQWLVVRTPGLPWPPWLARIEADRRPEG